MPWHAELILEAVLAVWLCVRPDGRKCFQSLLCINLLFEIAFIALDRTGHGKQEIQIWWALVVFEIPLTALALIEAGNDWQNYAPRRHRIILCWWIAATMGCAWIRFYPYTGMATIAVNQIAFLCWIWDKGIREVRE